MDGLASLMQQAPQGQPQQAPQAPMMGMNPRLDNAVEVVNNDIENLNLDPRTEYALKVQEASDLLASAERDLAMKQPQPTPPEVVDQRKQQVQQRIQQGVAGLLQQLMPGMQQRGMQMAAMQAPRQGGLPTQAAPNMARMMEGGIVGYKEGGFPDLSGDGKVTRKDILMGRGVINKNQGGIVGYQEGGEVYDDIGAMAALYKQASDKLYDPAATPEEKANAQRQIDMINAQAGSRISQVRRRVAEMSGTMDMEMAGGGYVKRYQAGDLVEEEADTYQTPGGFGPILRGIGSGLAGLLKPVYKGTVGPERQIVELTRALSVLNPTSPEAENIRQQIEGIRQASAGTEAPAPTRVPEEIDLSTLPQRRELPPDVDLLTGDTTEPAPAPTEQNELSSRLQEGILANLIPPDAAAAEERAMRAAGYSDEEIAARQRIRERQAELNRQLGEAETRDPRGQRLDRLIAFLQGAGGATSTAQALRGAGIGSMQERRRQEAEDLQFAENRRARELELLGLEQADIEQDRAIRVQAYEMAQDAINNQRSSFNQAIQSATQLVRGEKSDEIARQEIDLRKAANDLAKLQYEATLGRYNQQDLREQAKILLDTAEAMADNILSGLLPGQEGYAEAEVRAREVLNEVSNLIGDMLGVDPNAMLRLRQAARGVDDVEAEADAIILAGQR